MASFIPRKGPGGRRVWQAHIRRRGYPAQVRTFDTKAEAEAWAAGIEHEIARPKIFTQVRKLAVRQAPIISADDHEAARTTGRNRGLGDQFGG